MRIDGVIWLRNIVDKLAVKHHVEPSEVEQALSNRPKIRFIEKGDYPDEDVYMALGRTDSGRYLTILFVHKKNNKALILSARKMAPKERRQYGKK